ncbi:SDR family oxidoreductase [Clostridium estertheticum]|uniref:NmrA family NAD(P)-binding protein n=1 Tax=Clostridium estertheticum TaxID=238834 RepID=A0AA47EG35_9CLOT|nr:NmrA family NAD(P)-binding protein [Clostridium estertheticum]MBU3156606.1 NmrA family NAD(P)-binding protein [Clostridium estertheticum]WAG59366.1 NmrA family NAD(P)-binding protein [Clostridium estertheticum]
MILITGANGQTGRAIIKALLSKGEQIRAFVHKTEQIQEIKSLGEIDVFAGDMMNQKSVDEALIGINTVYHICSAVNPNEVEIGQMVINAARNARVEHFVYHSVLHSVLQDMPHHQKKLKVEELMVNSGIPYTIIQPAVFMQNILESWKSLSEKGIFQQKFFTTQETRMCMVDLEDLAEAVSIILTNTGYTGATYELCGPENLSLSDMLAAMELHFGLEIKVETPQDEMFAAQLKKHGVGDYKVNTLLKMFQHYNEHGFVGNPNVLTWILGRKPNDFSSFILRTIQSQRS